MKQDEGLMEIRVIRHQISEEFDHNIDNYIEYLQHQDAQYRTQIHLAEHILRTQEPLEEMPRLRKAA